MNYGQHSPTNKFLDSLVSHMLLPYIVQSIRIRNIYSNLITPNNLLGNFTATMLDHLPQLLIAPDIFSSPQSIKLNIFERDCSIKSNNGNVDQSFVSLLTELNSILDLYAH